MHGEPQSMQRFPMQGDAVPQVVEFLERASRALMDGGVARDRIAWDPGIGFGKTVAQNFALLARQRDLLVHGFPLLVGWSRKSSLGTVTGLPVEERLVPSIAAALLAVERGARVVRVHDVRETVAALKVRGAMISTEEDKGRDSQP
jgi:dihydropteroate synthase